MIHATLVGLAPGALFAWVMAVRYPSALLTEAMPFRPWAGLVWVVLNLVAGGLAGLLTRRQTGRSPA